MKRVSPSDSGGRNFKRPSDMVTLPDGRFLVRDDLGIQVRFKRNVTIATGAKVLSLVFTYA